LVTVDIHDVKGALLIDFLELELDSRLVLDDGARSSGG
jgi:hypothetical protein